MGSPQPLKSPDGNLIHLVYSAGGNRPPYSALGLMTAQSGSNLLDPASWKKSPQPVFCQNDTLGVSAPEHCSFIKSPDGTEDYIFTMPAIVWSQRPTTCGHLVYRNFHGIKKVSRYSGNPSPVTSNNPNLQVQRYENFFLFSIDPISRMPA